ncbi:hypothetical protein NKJ06_04785 [Mesorhizobium sp. M0293]|uniref:hypothetical protein n=1 Tax=Mesorhizobium sp. M0293 TaxID=2956930 RepID=UPI003337D9CB
MAVRGGRLGEEFGAGQRQFADAIGFFGLAKSPCDHRVARRTCLYHKLARAVLLDSAVKNRQQNHLGEATTPFSWPWTKPDLAQIHISSLVLRGIN